ncbi:MAG: 4Fe-4S binding protein [Deltaproteobacteria bacterium]|nr:4Fe-4S binding protein [Deltaproteobacteria bacterium]
MDIDRKKCIGCGLCVSTCKAGALGLMKKEKVFIPPKDFQELHEIFMNNKKTGARKIWTMAKAYLGLRVGELR